MRKEMIETGKNVDAAIDAACKKLGCEREECDWEIIDLPKKGFLGLKTYPAKVKVSIEVPDEVKPTPKIDQRKPEPARQSAPAAPRKEPPKAREPMPVEKKRPEPKPAQGTRQTEAPPRRVEEEEIPRVVVMEGFTEKEIAAMDYIQSILGEFGLTATLRLEREGSGICVNITGDGLGTIIGRRGETLDAIQYLTGLVANRMEGDYLRITVDCGDYRNKRKETLEALAKKLAHQVIKTNVSKTLEPMNPFERRVIHATVSGIEGVSSSSVGEEPNRRVVITSPTARRPAFRRDGERRDGDRRPPRDRDRGGYRGRPGGDRDRDHDRDRGERRRSSPPPRPSTAPLQGPPKQTVESEIIANAPLGKLDLE